MRTVVEDSLLALAVFFALAGCDLATVDRGAKRATVPVVVVTNSVDKAESVVAALEDATGKTLDPAVSEKGASVAAKVATGARIGAGAAVALGQPGIGGLLGGLAGLAGAIAAFFQRRKARAVAKAASRAADRAPGGGKALMAEAASLGVADAMAKAYRERKVD